MKIWGNEKTCCNSNPFKKKKKNKTKQKHSKGDEYEVAALLVFILD
jgi:hypothetical protein